MLAEYRIVWIYYRAKRKLGSSHVGWDSRPVVVGYLVPGFRPSACILYTGQLVVVRANAGTSSYPLHNSILLCHTIATHIRLGVAPPDGR